MRSTRLATRVSLVLALCACSSGSKSSQDGAAGTPDGARDVAGLGGSGGTTGVGGSTGAGGSPGGTSAGGGTNFGGALSSSATAGGTTAGTASGGNTSSPDAGTGGAGGTRLDGGTSSGVDASTPIDAPVETKPDGSVADVDTGRAEASSNDGNASGLAFCRATSTGCQCTSVASAVPTISACSKASLGNVAEGRCCKASAHCSCDSLACVADTSAGRCSCDFASLLSTLPPTWTKVAQCPSPASGTKCCLHASEEYCECKQQTCASGTTEVANCTLSQLSPCASGEQAVDTCK